MGLKRAGHQVTIATNENFADFVRQCGLEFVAIAPNFQDFLQSQQGQQLIAGEKLKPEQEDELLRSQLQSAWLACARTDVIIYTPLTNWAYHIAEKLGVPCFFASVIPMTPTGAFRCLRFAQSTKNPLKKVINYASYFIAELVYWQRYRRLINQFRTETLQLPPLPYLGKRFRKKAPANVARIPVLYGFSSHVIPRPDDWPGWVHVTGYWFIDIGETYEDEAPDKLLDFLGFKVKPLCIGFGSMTMPNPEYLTYYIVEALKKTHQGGVILSGWGNLGNIVNVKDSMRVCVVKDVPHDWLLPQVSAMIHHGGASTTAATLRAGIPSIVVPFFADQPVWGELLMRLGVSPAPIPYKKVTEDTLAAAIKVMLGDEAMRLKAQELGEKIRNEDGVANAVEAFNRHLGLIG
ncbi:putative glycosyl transferase, family 28 (plasmid) [Nostoc sp. NIES-2111]|nr:putative glycosyl transferase, family 28 [Nostoc sp. NIES-2111]